MSAIFGRAFSSGLRHAGPAGLSLRCFSATAVAPHRISEIIRRDHRELEEAYHNIVDAKTTEEKVQWRNQFTWELARHSIGEEMLVYPRIERLFSHGDFLADRDREEHLKIKYFLKDFQYMSPEDEEFNPTLSALWKNLKQHMEQEEQKDMVAIENSLSALESEHLARTFERTKMLTPTHSHPDAPDRPPFDTAAGLMAAPLDRIRDLFRKFPPGHHGHHPPPT